MRLFGWLAVPTARWVPLLPRQVVAEETAPQAGVLAYKYDRAQVVGEWRVAGSPGRQKSTEAMAPSKRGIAIGIAAGIIHQRYNQTLPRSWSSTAANPFGARGSIQYQP